MRFYFIVLLMLIGFTSSFGQTRSYKDLVGLWKDVIETKDAISLEIKDSVHVNWKTPQGLFETTYVADFTKNPYWFDVVANDGTKDIMLKGIIEFLPDGKLKWELFPNGQRKNEFSRIKSQGQTTLYKAK